MEYIKRRMEDMVNDLYKTTLLSDIPLGVQHNTTVNDLYKTTLLSDVTLR